MNSRIACFLLLCFIISNIACTQKSIPVDFDEEKYSRCEHPGNNMLDIFIWYVPKGENCCSGKGVKGSHETWKADEGITRAFVKSVNVDASDLQGRFCKEK